jgi:hypothetical protein
LGAAKSPFFDIIDLDQHLVMFCPVPRNSSGTVPEQQADHRRISAESRAETTLETATNSGVRCRRIATPVILWTDDEKEPRRGVTASPCAMRGDVESTSPVAVARSDVRLVRQCQ